MKDRTAIDTIKGYFYQFDYTILKLLELANDTDSIIVEGVEDVDIHSATEETAIQCKYYAKTEYNHSVIAKPIRLMLNHYKEVKNGTKKKVNYMLYGFYQSGQDKLTLPISVQFLKDKYLTYTEKSIKHFHHSELLLSDSDLFDFLTLLTVNIEAVDYQDQLSIILNLLIQRFGCNFFEAEHFYYNNALKEIKNISIEDDINKRRISKVDFLRKIDIKQILFNEWFVNYKGREKLFSELRSQYFASLNISPFERFFFIEVPSENYLRSELKDLIFTISRKWSKLSKREPNPFCPYLYLHNIHSKELLELKKELYSEDFIFLDGFDFEGAIFNSKSITRTANNNNQIKIKILNKLEFANETINGISKTKEIYQFYLNTPFFDKDYLNVKQIKIQFSRLTDIIKII